MDNKVELLAPAGSLDAGYAALEYGADALYLGLPKFSARAEATNFTEDEFYDIVGYAQHLESKVYVTLNTIIKESEIESLLPMIDLINKAGANGVIVQDLGVLNLIKTYFPNIRVHASTQMAIHNKAGAEYLKELGIKRVTLARELSIAEVADISSIDGLESESFLHGALCYSYSGLCMYSSMQTGRSANRGRCAYSCREIFSCPELDLEGHAFSLRDLSLTKHIDALLESGVDSLKIEGRKKSPLYVAAVVKLYRGIIDKRDSKDEIKQNATDLKTIFSRQSCDFFAEGATSKEGRSGAIDTDAVGHRGAIIGEVESITKHGRDTRLNFTTSQDFEKHDGIQVDIPDEERPYGFAVNELFKIMPDGRPKPTFIVEKGNKASIALPEDHPTLPEGAPVYLASSQRIKRELKWYTPKIGEFKRRYPVNINLTISTRTIEVNALLTEESGYATSVTASCIHNHGEDFSLANNPDQTLSASKKIFNKTGATPFKLHDLKLTSEQEFFVPSSLLNKLRREVYEELGAKLETASENSLQGFENAVDDNSQREPFVTTDPKWILKTDNIESILGLNNETAQKISEVIIEIGDNADTASISASLTQARSEFPESIIRIALPTICRDSRLAHITTVTTELVNNGFTDWQVGNLWGLEVLKGLNTSSITGASSLYAFNHSSIDKQLSLGLSLVTLGIEDDKSNIADLIKYRGKDLILTAYQDVPLFTGEACTYSSFEGECKAGCEEINNQRLWEDRRGNSYLLIKKGCRTVFINTKTFSLSGSLRNLNGSIPRYFQADFINRNYTSDEVESVLDSLFHDENIYNTHTGNFERDLI